MVTATPPETARLESPGKSIIKSQTVQGNILAILATVGSLAAMWSGGVPPELLVSATVAAVGSVWGNVMSIFGRVSATQKIK